MHFLSIVLPRPPIPASPLNSSPPHPPLFLPIASVADSLLCCHHFKSPGFFSHVCPLPTFFWHLFMLPSPFTLLSSTFLFSPSPIYFSLDLCFCWKKSRNMFRSCLVNTDVHIYIYIYKKQFKMFNRLFSVFQGTSAKGCVQLGFTLVG